MPRLLKVLLVLVVLGGAAASAYYFFGYEQERKVSDNLTLYATWTSARFTWPFHATGRIEHILVEEGDAVKKDQLVAELDPVRYQANLARSKAEVAAQEQVLARLWPAAAPGDRRGTGPPAAAKATLRDQTNLHRRNQDLYQRKAISSQTMDSIRAV